MARTINNCLRGLVFATALLGAAWLLRSYRLRLELKSDAMAAPSSTHAAADLRSTFRTLSGDSHATPAPKPWLRDLASYTQTHGGNWIVGQSRVAGTSETEAVAAARADAAAQIGNFIQTPDLPPQEHDWITRHIAADIRNGQLQTDSAVEQFDRPYGTIWLACVLMDISPQRLIPVTRQYRFEAHRRMLVSIGLRTAAIGMVILVWLAYFPMNVLTRGFFAQRLRFGAVLTTAAAILFLV